MDSNKKQNSVRYKCQVRDINKKACLTRLQPDICFVTKVARGGRCWRSSLFNATFAPTLPRYTLRQRHKCRLSECYTHSPMGWLLLREIMTTVYFFAKRCKSDRKVIDERNRPLTDEGVSASYKVMEILKDKKK